MFCLWLTAPVEAKKVAELTGMSRAAVSALVATLERDGLVAKDRSLDDGRAVQLSLTAKGLQAITSDFHAHNSREREWAAALPSKLGSAISPVVTASRRPFDIDEFEGRPGGTRHGHSG